MIRHWSLHIEPILQLVKPKRLMEVGADRGYNTNKLLAWCRVNGAVLDVVDPEPDEALSKVLARYPDEHVFHKQISVEALMVAEFPDLLLLDGDHNWSTVYRELKTLERRSVALGRELPVILCHDVAWPYARRDMYYVPDRIAEKHPYAYVGLHPTEGVKERGMNYKLANALHEGGPRNGVLTAIEDFIAELATEVDFRTLPYFNGLGIIVPASRSTPELKALVDGFFEGPSLLNAAIALEKDGMTIRSQLAECQILLAQRTATAMRGKALVQAQAEEIKALKAKVEQFEQAAGTQPPGKIQTINGPESLG